LLVSCPRLFPACLAIPINLLKVGGGGGGGEGGEGVWGQSGGPGNVARCHSIQIVVFGPELAQNFS
jgi:uncharacterized spore protein YtfJ